MRIFLLNGFLLFLITNIGRSADEKPPITTNEKSVIPLRIVPPKGEKGTNFLTARLVLNDHGVSHECQVYSAGIEVENLSGHAASVHFDPKDLTLELLDAEGKIIDEGGSSRSGPAPIAHDATIPTSGYVGFSTYRGGIGLPSQSILFAAGRQDWKLKPGTYRLRGSITVTVTFGGKVLDPEKPEVPQPKQANKRLPPPLRVNLKLAEYRFELKGPA